MSKISLENRHLLITGGTQGVGKAIAQSAIQCGARFLVLSGRDEKKGREVAAELSESGAGVSFVSADLTDVAAPSKVYQFALDRMGTVDGLVNAAGITTRGSFLDGEVDDWNQLFAVNARAPFLLMQQFIRHLVEQGAAGSIVNISSMNTHCGAPELAMYSASKGALTTLTKNAANAHLSDCIRVNAIAMGWSPTPAEEIMQTQILEKGADWISEAEANLPLGRMLNVQEVANLAVYLLSDFSGLQTGTIIDLEQTIVGAPR